MELMNKYLRYNYLHKYCYNSIKKFVSSSHNDLNIIKQIVRDLEENKKKMMKH